MRELIDPSYIVGHCVPEQIKAAGFECEAGDRGNKSKMIS